MAGSAPHNPYGPSPLRRPGSIRRTTTIDTSWPDGHGQPMLMQGVGRDVQTPAGGGDPVELARGSFRILASPMREIQSIAVSPDNPAAQQLVGVRGGGQSRAAIADVMGEERARATPLHQILDDFAGASLVAGWAWSRWVTDWRELNRKSGALSTAGRRGNMAGVCTGFAPGSTALTEDGGPPTAQNCAEVVSLLHPDDPQGWHELGVQQGVGMRRARRLDIWRDEGKLIIDIGFQDSGTAPNTDLRIAIHEYHVRVTAGGPDDRIESIVATPHVLPFPECPGAIGFTSRLNGLPIASMREAVLEQLPGTLGCTHLNDVLRSLADAPALVAQLDN
ncbi:MAG: DUF2889 domain-containing protein [Blastomonas sp.]